jgi:hypothetical protein
MTTLTTTYTIDRNNRARAKFKSWRIVVPVLLAAVNAIMCAGPGSLAAPDTLRWFGPLICPGGQQIAYEYLPTAGDAVSQVSQAVYCQDTAGLRTLASNRALGTMLGVYFTIFVVPALIVGLTAQFGSGSRRFPRPLDWEAEQDVRMLISAGHQAEAAKLIRQKSGGTPKWARDYIDNMAKMVETAPPRAPAPAPSPLDKLKQLKEMLDAGLITAKEYDAKKVDILGQI